MSDPRPYMHDGYVQTIRGGEGGYFASCPSCGCDQFPNRAAKEQAQADVDAHRTSVDDSWYLLDARRYLS